MRTSTANDDTSTTQRDWHDLTYRKLFTSRANQSAQVLIITSWHLRRADLWDIRALKHRPLVILDEDALSALTAPVELTVERLRRFLEHLDSLRDALSNAEEPDSAESADNDASDVEAALTMADIFRRAAEDVLRACATAGHGLWRPSEVIFEQIGLDEDRVTLQDSDAFFALVCCAYEAVRRKTALPNMLADLRELLLEPKAVHLSTGACRWTRPSSIPRDRQILMLDATAEPTVVEGVLGRPGAVEVIATPAIEQRATIYQVMDKIGTRAGNRRDLASEQSWTAQLATEVARRHVGQSLLCVTFKHDEAQLADLLGREHGNAAVIHYGALRGLNAYERFDTGLIIGRPMPNEAQLQLLAVAAFGREALDDKLRAPPLQWRLHTHDIGPDTWTVRCQQYDDERWQAVWRHVVTGELMQAIGRLRPLTNDTTIYVVTNEPLPEGPGALDVTAVYAAELFPAMAVSSRRSDFQQRVQQYADAMADLAAEGMEPTNLAVCKRLGLKPPNGMRYRRLAMDRQITDSG